MDSDSGILRPPTKRSLVGTFDLLRALVQKDIKVKYKRSVLGFLWSLITPIALTAVYLFVFVYVYKVGKKDFILFLLSGLLPWNFFNMSILAATSAIVENGPLVKKVYFPRALLPISSVVANLVNFLMGLSMLVVLVFALGRPIGPHLHWLLWGTLSESILLIGLAMCLSVWNVYLRDIQQLISILSMVLFFATPVVYPLSLVPRTFRSLILLNPVAGIMEAYRAAIYTHGHLDLVAFFVGLGESVLILAFGIWVMRRSAPNLAKEV
jgi:lipopolysaccharide transport system permease protein